VINDQSVKVYPILITALTNAATGTFGTFDCSGHQYARIDLTLSATNAVSNVPTTAKIQECDTTVSTSFADVSGGSMTSAFTNGLTTTTLTDVLTWCVDLRPRKRYLRVLCAVLTSQTVAGIVTLSRSGQAEISTAAANNVSAMLVL